MSNITPAGSNLPATQSPLTRPEGLEDFDTQDQVMPMLRIDHNNAVFVDGLSNQEYNELNVVALGLVKQRVLWPAQMKGDGDNEPPLCRSYNFNEGHPAPVEILQNGSEYERFPWDATAFQRGMEPLPCQQCPLKDWGSHPTRDAPWCSEQHTFAILFASPDGTWVPSLLQFQRSSLKPSRQYLSSFANANQPLFTVFTKISLEEKKYGSNPFCVPKFSRQQETSQDDWPDFSTMYRSIRDYLQTPPRLTEEVLDDGMPTTSVSTPAAPQQAAQQPTQAPQQAAPTAPPAAPQQAAQAAPTVAPAPAAQAPQQEQTPAEDTPQPAPSIATPAPEPVTETASTSLDDDDEIPF